MTNGEKIQEIFPNNLEISLYPYSPSVDIYVGGIMMMRIDRNWWSAEYKESKTGHWIEGQTDNPNIHNILCSCCFEGYPSKGHANSQYTKEKFQWCPKCGAKMIEPQESEE